MRETMAANACRRLATACCYDYVYTAPAMTIVEPSALASYFQSSQAGETATGSPVTVPHKRSILDPAFEVSASVIISVLTSRNVNWREAVGTYLSTINSWLHVLHPGLLAKKLDAIPKNEGPAESEFALLVVCMHLVTLYADAGRSQSLDGQEMFGNPEYVIAKRLLGLIKGFAKPSIVLIQCCILLAVFEFGHGDFAKAYISVGDAYTMAKFLEIQPGKYTEAEHLDPVDSHDEERRSIYWSMFVLDR